MIQICSGLTRGRMLNGELYAQRLQQVNLSAVVYIPFHEDVSSIDRRLKRNLHKTVCTQMQKLTSVISVLVLYT